MAEVYVAKTKGIGGFEKLVAIKVIHPRFSEDEHFIQMLVEEAKISVQLSHVNIAQTFDLGCIDDTYYIAMEFIDGADAYRVGRRAKERKKRLPVDIATYICAQTCNGLGYAHRKRDDRGESMGIVHRDVSPQNVLISFAGEVKLVDFGIAKAALRGGQTEVGVIKGKYYYMSPEQAWGDPVDQRSDIFSAGIVLHELLTGEMVYQGSNIPQLIDQVRKAEIKSPRTRRPEVSVRLEAILMRALAKEPEDRYQSAHAFAQDLTEELYKGNSTFTASRLAQMMATLFPSDARRNSQILTMPEAQEERDPSRPPPESLPPMSRAEFVPPKEASVVFDLGDADGDADDATRNDILPFRKRERETRELQEAAKKADPYAHFGGYADAEEEETYLKDESEWDDSTYVDDGALAKELARSFQAPRPASNADLLGEMTVVAAQNPLDAAPAAASSAGPDDRTTMDGQAFPFPGPGEVAPAKPQAKVRRLPPRPAPAGVQDKTALGAPAFPDPPVGLPPRRSKPRSVPPPGRLPPVRPPRARSSRPVPRGELPRSERARGEPPRSEPVPRLPVPFEPAPPPDPLGAPRELLPGAPVEMPPEPTMALADESAVPGSAAVPYGVGAGGVSGGIRLGPDAERFFEPAPPQEPFDPFGGVAVAGDLPSAPLTDPFAVQPGDPELARVPIDQQLGKPNPIRWIIGLSLLGFVAASIAAAGAWYAARPEPASLTLISAPEGAAVELDGQRLSDPTPVTLSDLAPGTPVRLVLTHPHHEPRTDSFRLREGENRRVYHLNPIRVTLRITSEPAGAQVWIADVNRGTTPLEIAGLMIGDHMTIRATRFGREVSQEVVIGEEPHQEVALQVPAAE